MARGFFDNLKDYSEIKLRILGRFLAPWTAKPGFWARTHGGAIWYVDGFSGPGRYQDGSDGSPLLGLRSAKHIRHENRGYELACFFVEKKRNHWESLKELARPFEREGININNRCGEFSRLSQEIADTTRNAPVLLFVDPFGLSPLKYDQFRILLHRPWPLDLILTFQHKAVHRLATDYPHLITEAIGTNAWDKAWHRIPDPTQQTDHILELFRQNILDDGNFMEVFFYPIRTSLRASPKYYLFFASRHYDAFELWNDEIAQEETALSLREYETLTSLA